MQGRSQRWCIHGRLRQQCRHCRRHARRRRDQPHDRPLSTSGIIYWSACPDGIWIERGRFIPPDGQSNDEIGYSAAVFSDGDTAVVGAPFDSTAVIESGSVRVGDLA